MISKKPKAITLATSILLLPSAYFGTVFNAAAQENDAATTNTTSVPKIMDRIRLNYWGMYSGSTLDFQAYHPNPDGSIAAPINAWNQIVAGYKATDRLQVDAQMIFDWKMSGGQELTMLNPRVGLSGSVYDNGRTSLWANLNAELPTNETAIREGLITSLGGFQEFVFNIPSSKFSGILMNSTRIYAYSNERSGQSLAGSVMPTLRYNLATTFKPFITVETPYSLARGANGGALTSSLTMIRPGFSWDINKRINVMPYLIFWPAGKMSADATSFGMWLSGSIL